MGCVCTGPRGASMQLVPLCTSVGTRNVASALSGRRACRALQAPGHPGTRQRPPPSRGLRGAACGHWHPACHRQAAPAGLGLLWHRGRGGMASRCRFAARFNSLPLVPSSVPVAMRAASLGLRPVPSVALGGAPTRRFNLKLTVETRASLKAPGPVSCGFHSVSVHVF